LAHHDRRTSFGVDVRTHAESSQRATPQLLLEQKHEFPVVQSLRSQSMSTFVRFFLRPVPGTASIFLIRLPVGLIFFTQGILKFIDPNMGVLRFARIGFPHPQFVAMFVGFFEIVCGLLVLVGLWTSFSAVPLLIVITTAIGATKIPELVNANQGFWYMVSDARTDFAMFCCLIFLVLEGGGSWSLDGRLHRRRIERARQPA
jgi:putative oxidoreductase